jgi:GNAT superfamily N-acetyltransferase
MRAGARRGVARHRSFLLAVTLETFRPRAFPAADLRLVRAAPADHARCRHLWREVGRGHWTARIRWDARRWRAHLAAPGVTFWIVRRSARDVGFFELAARRRSVKVEGVGLLPEWRGRHLGGGLVSAATERAFSSGAPRVWLHTATDDHPHALPNYVARGYRVYRERPLERPVRERRNR